MTESLHPDRPTLDLLIVGAGPTGIAIGAEARRRNLEPLVVDRGGVAQNLFDFPRFMQFFTTRDLLEIADLPFAIPEAKPDRRQALTYYQAVAAHYDLPFALREEVYAVRRAAGGLVVSSRAREGERTRTASAVAIATGYFHNPRHLGVPGEDQSWVRSRYEEAQQHFGESVVVVGGGNSAAETALELWRAGVEVTLVHRRETVKPSIKYWLRPDIENRIEEGSISAFFDSEVIEFGDRAVRIRGPMGERALPADTAFVLIGYEPDVGLLRAAGVEVDDETLVPRFDPASCESNAPGVYIAGTLQAGRRTDKIFIENSRDHGVRIVEHLAARLAAAPAR